MRYRLAIRTHIIMPVLLILGSLSIISFEYIVKQNLIGSGVRPRIYTVHSLRRKRIHAKVCEITVAVDGNIQGMSSFHPS